MSKQDGTQGSTKRHRSRQTSKQNDVQIPALQRPTDDDKEAWTAYWKAQGWSWRTEPEIDVQRQEELTQRRTIIPDIKQGIYPFKDIKLIRADVEWLLATHENGRGPINWSDINQRERKGLDIRGANLSGEDLRHLPLAGLYGGLTWDEWDESMEEQLAMAAVHMERVSLREAHLEGANLFGAYLEGAEFYRAYLEDAELSKAHLERTYLYKAHLGSANLTEAHLENAELGRAQLEGADLENVIFGDEKQIGPRIADVQWGNVNLAVVKWSQVKMLGDEYEAKQKTTRDGVMKDKRTLLIEYRAAMRANRQLAVTLQDQGMIEEGARFGYRARVVQRKLLLRRALWEKVKPWPLNMMLRLGTYVFSLCFDLLAGYGYKPHRSVIAYLVVIFGFMGLYLLNSHLATPHLRWDEALVLSVSSFHGRGFFSQNITLGDTYARLAAAEAVVGLVIEISFIATFTQRFFGR